MTRTFLYAALWSSLTAAQVAHAALPAPSVDLLRRLAPEQARELALRQTALQQARRLAGPTAALDTTPPVVTKFAGPKSVDVNVSWPGLLATISATDDLSGLRSIMVVAIGPSGQSISAVSSPWSVTKFSGTIGQGNTLTGFEEPGLYRFSYAFIYDTAGNLEFLDRDELVALGGRTDFTLKNKLGYDGTPPQLVAGKIQTTEASLSDTHPGTTMPPTLTMKLDVSDAGNTALSGVYFANTEFCQADMSHCMYIYGENQPPGRAATTLTLGNQLDPSTRPGVYHLRSVGARDYANNSIYLMSTLFGGPTDFSAYFQSTTITITP